MVRRISPAVLAAVSIVAPAPVPEEIIPLDEMEKRAILHALEKTGGNRTQAANLLKISIRTMRNKLHQYRIENGEPEDDAQEVEPAAAGAD